MTLVDTNILVDILDDNSLWADWSLSHMAEAGGRGELIIDPVTYAELSMGFEDVRQLDFFIQRFAVRLAPTPRAALFRAGRAFLAYRRAGGSRTNALPDFYIGAHAETSDVPLLTRDVRRYRTYFPSVRLIAPDV